MSRKLEQVDLLIITHLSRQTFYVFSLGEVTSLGESKIKTDLGVSGTKDDFKKRERERESLKEKGNKKIQEEEEDTGYFIKAREPIFPTINL